ncbi:hypothetical protein tinsulaeT_06610 [Thalassotalea insulae]|uniref:DUF4340 domain-containing protein n=1 Tax=Thalassotalea insulae TaxID=2056778 RepID=A0ABQ6GN76_9GAMM|nr:DUF4340 domain-containing protein [Thalassotalea insulae]GLX77321.1 hypothetical protein tinsulaeT_06610 [Thalassotalea insulae]
MNKHITLLSALFLLQLVVTGLLFSADSAMENTNVSQALVSMKQDELNKVQIIAENTELTLIKRNDRWRLEGYPKLPLAESKVAAVTDKLIRSQVTWPVTNTQSSHERFKVANDSFEKHIIYTDSSGERQALLLGKSPSFKQLYVRNSEQDEVFSIEFSAYQLSTEIDDWLDKTLLSVDGISQISHAAISLAKRDEKWQLVPPSTLGEQQTLDSENIQELVNQLTSLSVSGLANNTPKPVDKLIVHDDQGQEYIYSFASNEDSYFVKREDINQWFTLSKRKFDKLANLSLDKFISKVGIQEENSEEKVSE